MKSISNPTAAVIIAGITATVLIAIFGSERFQIAVVGSIGIVVAGVMRALFPTSDGKDAGGNGGAAALIVLSVACVGVGTGCATLRSQKAEAEEAYTAAQTKCAATEPSREAVAACRARVRDEWLVRETQADKDGGR